MTANGEPNGERKNGDPNGDRKNPNGETQASPDSAAGVGVGKM